MSAYLGYLDTDHPSAPDDSDPIDNNNINDDDDILPSFGPRLTLEEAAPAENANIVNFADLGSWVHESSVCAILFRRFSY